jgi:molybdenum cofactor synthesis domain-containing protein
MANEKKTVTAALIIIGNEILSGRTHDKNLPHIAKTLGAVGVRLSEARVVPDVEDEIIDAVNTLRRKYDYVFTTGGIGPTHDDITAECVAKAFGRKLIQHPEARRRMAERSASTGTELNEARLRMANTPEGAELIDNPVSAAPGFRVENVHVMAGVPQIMRAMLDNVKDSLVGGAQMMSKTVLCTLGEGTVASGLGKLQKKYPDVDIGSYPQYNRGGYRVSLVLRATEAGMLAAATAEVAALVRDLGGDPEVRDGDDSKDDA